jgi:3-oxoacyl-[acyl-carrier protein] reductase
VENLVPAAEERMGGLDTIINNAGITKDGLMMRMKDEDFQDVIRMNLENAFRLSRAALKPMGKNRFGRIINISSIVGVTGNPGQSNYCAAKAGLIGMSKALAAEMASRNITVNCIAPGFIATPMTDVLSDDQKKKLLEGIPARRMGDPKDIAAAVVFLASNEAAYVTGQTIHVNGGMAMI